MAKKESRYRIDPEYREQAKAAVARWQKRNPEKTAQKAKRYYWAHSAEINEKRRRKRLWEKQSLKSGT